MQSIPAAGTASFHPRGLRLAVMSLRATSFALFFAICLAGGPRASAQDDGPNPNVDQGIKPYQAVSGGDIDTVNMANGSLVVHIPIVSYPQRGKTLKLSFSMIYNSKQFSEQESCTTNKSGGVKCVENWVFGNPWTTVADGMPILSGCGLKPTSAPRYNSCSITMSDGSVIPFGQISSGAYRALDGSGWQILWNGTGTVTLIDKQGTQYTGTTTEDSNGNIMVGGGEFLTENPYTDTMGRVIPKQTATTNYSACTGTQAVNLAEIWNLPGINGGNYPVEFCYANYTVVDPPAFSAYGQPYSKAASLLESIVLPNGTSYTFSYDSYGDLTSIVTPTNLTLSYTWASLLGCPDIPGSLVHTSISQYVASRGVNTGDGTGTHTYTYNFGAVATGSSTTRTDSVTDPLGNETVFTQTGLGNTCSFYETNRAVYQGPQSAGQLLQNTATTYAWSANTETAYSKLAPYSVFNAHPMTVTTTLSNGLESEVTNGYDSGFTYSDSTTTLDLQYSSNYGLVLSKKNYDYGASAGVIGSLLKTTTTNYLALSNPTYLSDNLLDLPSSVQVMNSAGTQVAYTTYGYDAANSLETSGISTQHSSTPPDGSTRGNQTSVSKWLNANGSYLTTAFTNFDTGEVDVATDPKGNTTTYAYSPIYAGALTTSVTNALNQTTIHGYDFNSGLLTSTTDPNSQTTSYSYDPLTFRMTETTYPDGGELSFCYSDTASEGCTSGPPYSVIITKKITASANFIETAIVDGLGKPTEIELNSDPSGVDYTAITYDADGRKATQTNPYRTSGTVITSTEGTTSYQYDALNRPTLVTKPDNSTVITAYNGNATTVTDEAGKTRESFTDALGRMTEVIENPGGLNWATNYTFDALDDLIGVVQGGSHTRTFVYDSLKRLTSSLNPETGTTPVLYTYDSDSNVLTKKDARGITITYSWDALNRMLGRTYSNGDPSVNYGYDSATCVVVSTCYNIGRRTSTTDAAGSESFAFDKMGRVWGDQRTTNTITKNASYVYNLDGSVATLTYPSGRTITYAYNAAAQPTNATDVANEISYVSDGFYTPHSALMYRASGLSYTTIYNSRLQPCWSWAGTGTTLPDTWACTATATAGEILDTKYNYNLGADNGNLVGITNDRNGNRSQVYGYDQVNRITSAATVSTCTASCWSLAFGLDQWANLKTATATGTATALDLSVSASNQIITAPFAYDASGNETADATSTYAWNAESEIKTGGGVTYLYDGQGNRAEKSGTKLYWYGAAGEVLDETDTTGSFSNATFSEYVYFGGQRIARRDYQSNVFYYYTDQVGSSRSIMEVAAGTGTRTLCYDADFYPYGGEDVFTNTCAQNYKFDGKERDPETGDDYFGARFYSSTYGRFLSADWSSVPLPVPYANLSNPQTLNLYAFVHDNPESFADLDGHCPGSPDCPGGSNSPRDPVSANQKTSESAANNAPGAQPKSQAAQCAKWGCGGGTPQSEHPDIHNSPPLPTVEIGASVTIGNANVNNKAQVSAVVDVPSAGASIDITIGGRKSTDKVMGSVGVGLGEHLGADTDLVKQPDGTIQAVGVTVHVGVSTPTLPVHGATAPRSVDPEFIWVLRANPSSRGPLQ